MYQRRRGMLTYVIFGRVYDEERFYFVVCQVIFSGTTISWFYGKSAIQLFHSSSGHVDTTRTHSRIVKMIMLILNVDSYIIVLVNVFHRITERGADSTTRDYRCHNIIVICNIYVIFSCWCRVQRYCV